MLVFWALHVGGRDTSRERNAHGRNESFLHAHKNEKGTEREVSTPGADLCPGSRLGEGGETEREPARFLKHFATKTKPPKHMDIIVAVGGDLGQQPRRRW